MRKYIVIFLILLNSCSLSNLNNRRTIPYVFPTKVTLLTSDYLIKNEDVSFLYLSKLNDDWKLTFIKCKECENEDNIIKNTRRKIFVNKKFYPLIFDSDEIFSIKESASYLKSKNMRSYTRSVFQIHNAYHIIFNNDVIIYNGYR